MPTAWQTTRRLSLYYTDSLPQTTGEMRIPSALPCKGEGSGEGFFRVTRPIKCVVTPAIQD